jgi:hypothetical protein
MADKTRAILRNTESILKEAGAGLDGVVKVVVCLPFLYWTAFWFNPDLHFFRELANQLPSGYGLRTGVS